MLRNQIKKLRDRESLPQILLIILACLLAFKPIVDHDFWWHLAAGRWMWQNHSFISTDPFSYTFKGAPWTSITWGYELIIYALSQATSSYITNSFFHMAIAIASLFFTWKSSEILLHKKNAWLAFFVFIVSFISLDVRWVHRPELITHFCASAILYCLLHFQTWPSLKPKILWWIPLLQLLWVNGHGIFLMGPFLVFGFYGQQILNDYIQTKNLKLKNPYLKIALVTTLVCAINPRGLSGMLFPIHLIGVLNDPFYQRTIPEATNPLRDGVWTKDTWLFVLWTLFLVFSLAFIAIKKSTRTSLKRVGFFYILFQLLLIWFALSARRNISLFIILSLPLACFLLSQLVQDFFIRYLKQLRAVALLLFAILFTLIFSSAIRSEQSPYRFTYNRASSEAPSNAKKFLEKNNLKLRTFNNVETGNYLLGTLPWFEPFIDSRFAEVYSADHFKQYMDILAHPEMFNQTAQRFNFELVVLSYNPPLARGLIQTLARDENWALIFIDEVAVIFLRRDLLLSRTEWSRHNRSASEILRDSLAHLLNYPPRSPWWNFHADYDVRVKPLTQLAQAALLVGAPDVAENILMLINQTPSNSVQVASLRCSVQYMKVESLASQKSNPNADLQREFLLLSDLCKQAKQRGDLHTSGMILGLFYFNTQDYTSAAAEFRQILNIDPISYEAHLMMAQSLGRTNEWKSSLVHFKEALRLRPHNTEAAYKAAEACQANNDKTCTISFLEEAYARDQNPQTLQWLNNVKAN